MPANWSLILNVLLLIGVVVSIGRMMKARRQSFNEVETPMTEPTIEAGFLDDIIAVRKISENVEPQDVAAEPVITPLKKPSPSVREETSQTIMLFLQAKENRLLAGYDLLQTVLAVGLRFGEGQLFHRHQYPNGQGPVLCSLAAATATGVFDLQNIGAFSVRGLCLFMQSCGNSTIDAERFKIMLKTARELSQDLDTHLLDFQQRPLTDETLSQYYRLLNIA